MKMKTAQVVTCLVLLTTAACGTADFSVAVADSGTPDTDPMTVDVQTKPDADPMPKKTDADPPHHDAGVDSKAPTPDSAIPVPDSGHDAGEDTSKEDAGKPTPDSGMPDPDSGSKKDADADAKTGEGGSHEDGSHEDGSTSDSSILTCAGKTPKCSGNILITCSDGGTDATPCSGTTPVCLELAGVGTCVACEPGTAEAPDTQCANHTAGYYSAISTCSAQGQWVTQTCSPNTPVCSGPSGTASCGGVCVPGSSQCGHEYAGPNAGTGGPFCPATENCSCYSLPLYQGIEQCDNTGNWGFAYDCNPGNCGTVSYCHTVAGQGVCS